MPKIIDHDQRRREIVEVAKDLILRGGFEAATMRSIVAAAGYANGALKRYFPNKESIVAATFESVLGEMNARIDDIDPALPPAESLRRYVEAALPLDEHRIAAARVLLALWEYSVANEELAELYRSHLATWRARLAAHIAEVRGYGESEEDPDVLGLAGEVVSVSIGANVASLMFACGTLIPEYEGYVDRLLRRITE